MRVRYCDLCGKEAGTTVEITVNKKWGVVVDLCPLHDNELQVFLSPRPDAVGFRERSAK